MTWDVIVILISVLTGTLCLMVLSEIICSECVCV